MKVKQRGSSGYFKSILFLNLFFLLLSSQKVIIALAILVVAVAAQYPKYPKPSYPPAPAYPKPSYPKPSYGSSYDYVSDSIKYIFFKSQINSNFGGYPNTAPSSLQLRLGRQG